MKRFLLLLPVLVFTGCPSYECQDGGSVCGEGEAVVCADFDTDRANCGGCGVTCAFEQACVEGACVPCEGGDCGYALVAACSTNGKVVGIEGGTGAVGSAVSVGPNRPLAVVPFRDVLLVPDTDAVLSQVRQQDLATVGSTVQVGDDARFITTDDPFIYVVNSVTGTVQIFEAAVGATPPYALTLRSELPLSETDHGNTYAQGVAKVGSTLYIPLQGGFGEAAAQGQKVLKVDVSNAALPTRAGAIDLSTLDLKPFEGSETDPRPADITVHQGALYVTLANWDAFYTPAGPGMLAKISLPGEQVTAIDLGAEACLSATYVKSDGQRLYVSCSGQVQYGGPPDYAISAAEKAGLVVVEGDQRRGVWSATCGTDCTVPVPSRFAIHDGEVYVGDQNGGRLYILGVNADGSLTERRGHSVAEGPIQACSLDDGSTVSNLIDLVALP